MDNRNNLVSPEFSWNLIFLFCFFLVNGRTFFGLLFNVTQDGHFKKIYNAICWCPTIRVLFYTSLKYRFIKSIFFSHFIDVGSVSAGIRGVSLEVDPPSVRRGQHATFICSYELDGTPLYSVKFYRGIHEFYRYSPSELPTSKIFPFPGFNVDVSPSFLLYLYCNFYFIFRTVQISELATCTHIKKSVCWWKSQNEAKRAVCASGNSLFVSINGALFTQILQHLRNLFTMNASCNVSQCAMSFITNSCFLCAHQMPLDKSTFSILNTRWMDTIKCVNVPSSPQYFPFNLFISFRFLSHQPSSTYPFSFIYHSPISLLFSFFFTLFSPLLS